MSEKPLSQDMAEVQSLIASPIGEVTLCPFTWRSWIERARALESRVAELEKDNAAMSRVCENATARRHDPSGEVMGRYDDEMDNALYALAALRARPPADGEPGEIEKAE